MDRLDKILVAQNIGSRKEVQKLIRQKYVTVDGDIVTKSDIKIDPEASVIKVSGQAVSYKKHLYIMMNKPSGVVSASEDKTCKTVIDLLPDNLRRKGLFPAGRLDKDTEGLLIITDDGDFAHKILSPKNHVYKRYYAKVDNNLTENIVKSFKMGIILADGTKCLPAKLEINDSNSAYVEICEGKFHQVKKMFASCGLNVQYLKRVSIGGLKLDSNLPIGGCRELTKNEQCAFFVVK